jgi:hypothetical protein
MKDYLKERLRQVGPQEILGQEYVIQSYEHMIINALDGHYEDWEDVDNIARALERVKENAIKTVNHWKS